MFTIISKLTETKNILINSLTAFVLTFIFVCILAIIVNVCINPGAITFGSF